MNFNGLACAINMGRNKRIRLSFKSPRIQISTYSNYCASHFLCGVDFKTPSTVGFEAILGTSIPP